MELQDLKNLANLARIEFSDEELTKIGADFASILGYVEQINNADISEITTNELQKNVFRDDAGAHKAGVDHETLIAAAPDSQDGFYKVPKIL